jgi:hypothetical protein
MTDYNAMIRALFTAPARGMTAQPPQANLGGGMIEKLHNALDPVQAMGGYGNLAAMALPPGATRPYGSQSPIMDAGNRRVGTIPYSEMTKDQIKSRIRQIEYDRKLAGKPDGEKYPPHGELSLLRRMLKD